MKTQFNRDVYEYDPINETYVDDQCCENCAMFGSCPLDETEIERRIRNRYSGVTAEKMLRAAKKRIDEDGIKRGGELVWCIYWKERVYG